MPVARAGAWPSTIAPKRGSFAKLSNDNRRGPRGELCGKEAQVDEDKFNMSLRKFLKQVGVTSQREIERIVREKALEQGKLKVKIVLTAAETDLNHVVEAEIDLG